MSGGQLATLSQGTATPAVSITLTGHALTVSQGDLQSGIVGQALTASLGTVSPVVSITLTGQEITVGQGTLALDEDLDTHITASQGTLSPVVSLTLTGQELTVSQGDIEQGVAPTNIELTGQELTTAQGSFSTSTGITLAGFELTASIDTLTGVASGGVTDVDLTGQVITASIGTLTAQGGQPSGETQTEGGGSWNLLGHRNRHRRKKPLVIKFSDFETRDAYEAALAEALIPKVEAVPIEREVDTSEQVKPKTELFAAEDGDDDSDDDKLITEIIMRLFH